MMPSLPTTCSYCLRTERTVRACTGCRGAFYCSTPCQKADWSLVHKPECKVFQRVRAQGHDVLPMPVRALVQMLLRADMKEVSAELEGHVESFMSKESEWTDMQLQANAALHFLDREATAKRVAEFDTSLQDRNLHRSQRQKSLKDRWHSDCTCDRCKDDLDVYQVALKYPHIELNSLSLNPGLMTGRRPADAPSVTQSQIEEIYLSCTQPQDLSNPKLNLMKWWQLCEPFRRAGLFAVAPVPQIISEASVYFAACQDLPSGLALSCLLMLANVLSNTILLPRSLPAGGASKGKVARALENMDQVTLYQAILAIIVCWGPSAHSKDWLVYRQAVDQLEQVESLPGRDEAKSLVKIWAADIGISEATEFFELHNLKYLRELAEFANEIMDSELGTGQKSFRGK
ncbi:hypothetical protein KJ359_003766 [Pestalotiopsis sp. 9143b]|nr:hypothetical protein KJ359_003766 [Pestalotiopsis sp. 9143b]